MCNDDEQRGETLGDVHPKTGADDNESNDALDSRSASDSKESLVACGAVDGCDAPEMAGICVLLVAVMLGSDDGRALRCASSQLCVNEPVNVA
jgi:hypothetical protein